jgi:hypothetical protein
MQIPRSVGWVTAVVVVGLLASCRGGISREPPVHLVHDMDFQQKLKAQSESTYLGWKDGRGMRLPVAGTLARGGKPGGSRADEHYVPETDEIFATYDRDADGVLSRLETRDLPFHRYRLFRLADRDGSGSLRPGEVAEIAKIYSYKKAGGSYVTENPVPRTREVLMRGRERFDIHCAVCHGRSGKNGMVSRRWPVPVPDLVEHEDATTRARLVGLPPGEIFETVTMGKGTMPGYAPQIALEDRWAIVHYLKALQQHFND